MGFADAMDHSMEVEDRLKDYELQKISKQAKLTMPYTGACYFCSSDIPSPKVFCDINCRDDYARLERMRKINGQR